MESLAEQYLQILATSSEGYGLSDPPGHPPMAVAVDPGEVRHCQLQNTFHCLFTACHGPSTAFP